MQLKGLMRRFKALTWTIGMCLLPSACGDSSSFELPPPTSSHAITEADAGPQRVATCDQAANGTACGTAGGRMHCIFNDCVKNACGDGVVLDGEEECDDGNERDGDGCDMRCRREAEPGCGNGVVEMGEECDDGNSNDDDLCTHLCKEARCGDKIVSRGEDCDDGNSNDLDACTNRCRNGGSGSAGRPAAGSGGSQSPPTAAGSGGGGLANAGAGAGRAGQLASGSGAAASGGMAGAAGMIATAGAGAAGASAGGAGAAGMGRAGASGGAGMPGSLCDACRQVRCKNVGGIGLNAYGGCLKMIDTIDNADPSDPMFLQSCMDVLNCAYRTDCAYGLDGVAKCYCGTATTDDCIKNGPAADAQCVAEVRTASRATTNDEVTERLSSLTYPIGWAFFLLQCDRDSCSTQCTP